MAMFIVIKELHKEKVKHKTVKAVQVTPHLAIRDEGGIGWSITHLPSGYCLPYCGFQSQPDATTFARGIEAIFGDCLDNASVNCLVDAPKTAARLNMLRLLERMSEDPNSVYTMKEVTKLAREINGQHAS